MTDSEFRVLVADDTIRPEGIRMLEEVASLTTLPAYSTEEQLLDAVRDADAILSRTAMISGSVVAAAPRLQIVSRHGVGLDYVDVEACTQHGVIVTITGDANSQAVSEHAFASLMAVARQLILAAADLRSGTWDRERAVGVELYRKTLGIVGLGRIGSRMARHARGFDMQVIACDPYIDSERARGLDVALVDLETLLRRSDFVSLHVPLTEETRGLIGRAELAWMKPSAILVNTARGGVIEERALYEALAERRIAGAALDVFAEEPLPAGHPLVLLDNVVCTPHCAGQTEEALVRVSVRAAENILCVYRGEVPPLVVNPEALENRSRAG